MLEVRAMASDDIDVVVARVMRQQALVATSHDFINGAVDDITLADSLYSSLRDASIAERDGRIVGHLRGVVLPSEVYGRSAWMNPEGLSYDDDDTLVALYVHQAQRWITDGARRHYVWVPTDTASIAPWLDLGFSYMHQRGVRLLDGIASPEWPAGYSLRRGTIADLETAIALDDHLHEFQEQGPSFSIDLPKGDQREDWTETLEDPTVHHYIVDFDGEPVAQCATFPLPDRVGSFDGTLHLSAVTVREDHRGHGIGRAMVSSALLDGRADGFHFVETNWRITNRSAATYWQNFGFVPTYRRLHRAIGVG